MEISILLAEQIIAMFLTMAVGFGVVRAGLFKTEDSRIISNMVVYICNPCVVVHAFQIELTDDKIKGLMIAVGMSVIVHVILIVGSELLSYIIHFNSIEKASIIYTNAGYLVIPLVSAVLGEEWVFYTTAFILVQTILMWTHGVNLIGQEKNLNIRKILCNPNVIAMIIGIALFALEIRLPAVIDSCVSGFGYMIRPASMMVIGMVSGDVDLRGVFRQKRPYLICMIRLILFPLIAAIAFAGLERTGLHPDAEYILMIVLIATAAPAAAMVTQLAQIYEKDSRYASVINVMSVICCIITMPLMVLIYEILIG